MSFLRQLREFLGQIEISMGDVPEEQPINVLIAINPEQKGRFREMMANLRVLEELLEEKEALREDSPKETDSGCSFCKFKPEQLPIGLRQCQTQAEAESCIMRA